MAKPTKHGKNWRIRWIDESGVRRSEVYQNHTDALFTLKRHQTISDEICRGLRAPSTLSKTFKEAVEYYLKFKTPQKKSPRDDKMIIGLHLSPFFDDLKLEEIGGQIDAYKLAKSHLSKKTLHNHLTLLISIMRTAFENGWLVRLPQIKKPQIRMFDKDFRFLKSKNEISAFLNAAREETAQAYALYGMAIYTGMRAGELAGLRWEDVDFEKKLICIQRSYEGTTKNGEVRYVPIVDALYPMLAQWKMQGKGNLVFQNEEGKMYLPSARIFQEVFKRVLTRARLIKMNENNKKIYSIRFHDLRHTFASHWMMNGGDLFKLQKILGHKSTQMTMRYAHLALGAFKDDLGRFGSALPSNQEGNVIRLR